MADFDLTQTDQQVQNILNDAQGAMGASAQTTLTTEYVMLKDTNGIYHKILKSSFTEAIRDVLAGLLVNNDKGTTINQIAAIASGDFGSITPANLASVLGVNTAITDKIKVYSNASTGITTTISCNAITNGRTILVLFSRNQADGDATVSAIYMLRCGYDGNHLTTVEIAKSGTGVFPTFSVNSSGLITADVYGCYMFIVNK